MQNRTRTKIGLAISLLVSSGLLGAALDARAADETPATQGEPDSSKVISVVVTGSHIPVNPDKVAVSVVSIDAEQMEKAGVSSDVLDILRKEVPAIEGRGNAGSSNANNNNQNTAGGAQMQLRNLDTLVLVDGRRVAISGVAAIGGKAFVDVNQIPPSAIERIEVLPDGSSAAYGSDAVGGVINIILKHDYEGGEISGRYGSASGYSEQSSAFTAGKALGDLHFTVSGSEGSNTPLYQNQRDFSTGIVGRVSAVPGTFGGATPGILAAGSNSPSASNPTGVNATATSGASLFANGTYLPTTTAGIAGTYDLSRFQTLILKENQKALSANFDDNLMGKKLVLFGDVEISRNTSNTQFLPITSTLTVPAGAPYNPLTTNFSGVNFANWAQPHQFSNNEDSERFTLGLRGDLGNDWGWEAAYLHSSNTLDQRQSGVYFKPNLASAIAGGYDAKGNAVAGGGYSKVYGGYSASGATVLQPALDPFARVLNPGALTNLYGTEAINTSSYLNSLDATIHGNVMQVPAGNLGFAAGLSTRREGLAGSTDPNGTNTGPTAQLWGGGSYFDPFAKSRTINAIFAEFNMPVFSNKWSIPGAHALDLIGAYRQERYSDAGEANVPKIGFRWQPVDAQVTVRGAYSKSFTAPTLYSEYGPTDTRTVGSGVITTVFGIANPGFNGMDGNNPNLQPSKSQTRSLSITILPKAIPGLSLTGEYHNVSQNGYPGGAGFTNILQSVDQLGSASPFTNSIAKGNFPGLAGAAAFANPGDLSAYLKANPNNATNVYAIDYFRNLGGVRVESYSLNAGYQLPTENYGAFALSSTGTILKSYLFQALPGQKFYEYAGYATNGGTGVQGTLPKYNFYSSIDWTLGKWNATLGNNYMSSVTDIGAGGIVYETSKTLKPLRVDSYMTWDMRVSYTGENLFDKYGKEWTIAFGINNIANTMPPLSPQAFTDNNADVSTYSPIGRLAYLSANVKF